MHTDDVHALMIEVARLQRECNALHTRLASETARADRNAKEVAETLDALSGAADRAVAAESERDALRAALDGLVKRLDFVHADASYQSVWTLHQIHMGPYQGPRYVDELDKARAALASGGDRG